MSAPDRRMQFLVLNPVFTNRLCLPSPPSHPTPGLRVEIPIPHLKVGKEIHIEEAPFLSGMDSARGGIEQGVVKFHPQQVVTLAVGHPDNLRSQIARTLGNGGRSGQGSARDFKRNLRCWPKDAVNGNQGTSGGDVQGGGELKEVLSALVAAAYEYWDGQR
jgi:hypothetical protein